MAQPCGVKSMNSINDITKKIIAFRDARDWKQFHKPKDLAISLMLEAAEVAEHFQWKNDEEIQEYIKKNRKAIGDELADVLYWVLLMSYDLGIDISRASIKKLAQNNKKYPISKSKGKHNKYNQL